MPAPGAPVISGAARSAGFSAAEVPYR